MPPNENPMATEARVTAVIEAEDKASGVLNNIGNSFGTFGTKVAALGGALGIAGAAMIKVSNDVADFNTWIARAGSNVDATAQQLQEFRNIAIAATKDTLFNAEQAAAALYQLAGGSISAEEAMTGLQQAVQFATANGLENLDDAAIAVANVMTLFKLRGEDAARAMDVLTAAGHAAFGTTEEMIDAFKQAAPTAAQLGMTVEELSGILAAMADAGFRGMEAGVGVKRALEQLAAPSKQVQEAMDEIGLSIADAEGNFIGLAAVLDQIQQKTGDMSALERAAALSHLFGQEAGPKMMALLNMSAETRRQYIEDMANSEGATAKAAAAINESVDPMQRLSQRFFEFETKIAPGVIAVLEGLLFIIDKALVPVISFVFNAAVATMGEFFYQAGRAGMWLYETVFPGILSGLQMVANAFVAVIETVGKFIAMIKSAASAASTSSFSWNPGGSSPSSFVNPNANFFSTGLNKFDSGGMVPGFPGQPQLAIVHGGERVVGSRSGSSSAGGLTINITGNTIASHLDLRDLADRVGREVMRNLRFAQAV